MYDEKQIEDSLAFAREIKAKMEGKNLQASAMQSLLESQASSQESKPSQGQMRQSSHAQPATQTRQSVQGHATSQLHSSQRQPQREQGSQQTVQAQSVRPQIPQGARPQQPAQAPQGVRPQQPVQSQPVHRQPMRPQQTVQPQTARPQQPTQPQAPQGVRPQQAVQPQAVRPQQPTQPQAQQGVRPQQQVQGQPQVRPQQPTQGQNQVRPQQPVHRQPMRPQQPVQSQGIRPVPSGQAQANGMLGTAPIRYSSSRPVEPRSTEVADEAIQQLRAMRQAQEATVAGTVPQGASGYPEDSQTWNAAATAEMTDSQKSENSSQDNGHTVEITIKFDMEGIKKKFGQLKKKLAPEPRTLDDVNAAMEENRQIKAERNNQDKTSIADKGSEIADKAKRMAKRLPSLGKKNTSSPEEGMEVYPEDGVYSEAVDGQIASLEGELVEESPIASRIQDIKDAISARSSSASKIFFNIIIVCICVGIAYFFASFATTYIAHSTTVEGESMEPTLSDGDTVIIQRLSYYFVSPSRYDVVVFPVSYDDVTDEDTYYIKRVIGLPGETVQIIDGSVYINGEELKDDKYALSDILDAGVASTPMVLGEDQYFVMGDNRNMSTDSRNSYVGLVNKNDIVGEAWICTWPLRHFGSLKR